MKPTTPSPFSTNARIFTSLFITFLMLVTPLVPMVSARSRAADYGTSNYKNSGAVQPGAPSTPPGTTIVSATKTDSFPDPNNDGKAEEGDTITFSSDVSYSGSSALNYTWTVSPPTARILTGAGTPTPAHRWADSGRPARDRASRTGCAWVAVRYSTAMSCGR